MSPRKPKAKPGLAAWIEANVFLAEGFVAEPGRMKLYPYQREMADAIGDPAIERVTVLKASRVGYTALLTGAIGFWCVAEPGPILILLPTESDCRDFMCSDIETTFAASPALQSILVDESRVGQRGRPLKGLQMRNTILARRFEAGSLKIVPAKAPRNLRRHSARYLVFDECSAMENSLEGDVVALAEKRTLSFANRKIVLGSTPLHENDHVFRAYLASDMRVFELPCPDCGAFSEIVWSSIEWPSGEPERAAWRCPNCAALVPHRDKARMLSAGRWRPTAPHVKGHAGFKLSALVSPLANASWGKLAAEFLKAKDDPETLRPFVNCTLAEPWRQQGDELDESSLASRVEPFGLDRIPPAVLCITAGCDVQADALHVVFAGWSKVAGETFILAHVILHGPTDAAAPIWQDLDGVLKQRWQHPHGGMIGIDAAAIDAGSGSHYDIVMKFAAARASRRVFAIKGACGFGRPSFKASTGLRSRGHERLFIVGSDSLKLALFERLKRGALIRFSDSLGPEFFEELTAERLCTTFSRGRPSRRFELAPGKRNEALDAICYATAARAGLALNLDMRESALKLEPQSAPASRVTRSKWLDGLT